MVDAMVPMPYEFDGQEVISMPRRNKYGAKKCELDGYRFDSQAEMRRYLMLREMQKCGEIEHLEVHPKYRLLKSFKNKKGQTVRGISYTSDFRYSVDGNVVVEDVKGGKATQTQAFRIKAKLFQAKYPQVRFEVVEM